jgi:hypothetical protein
LLYENHENDFLYIDGADFDHRSPELLHHHRLQANVRQTKEYDDQSADGFTTFSSTIFGSE